jgi:hypothetical protein
LERSEEALVGVVNETESTEESVVIDYGGTRGKLLVTDKLKFMQLRYYTGGEWTNSWTSAALPLGVELSLGNESLAEDGALEDYPGTLFRRIIFLPLGNLGPSSSAESNMESADEDEEV